MMRNYTELSGIRTFEGRYEYLRLTGFVGSDTFGHERWMNQRFYLSREWKRIRDHGIARDLGCNLGIPGQEIVRMIQVHHMNPMRPNDLIDANEDILDPEFLISVSHDTHNAIHYGAETPVRIEVVERLPGDTTPW